MSSLESWENNKLSQFEYSRIGFNAFARGMLIAAGVHMIISPF